MSAASAEAKLGRGAIDDLIGKQVGGVEVRVRNYVLVLGLEANAMSVNASASDSSAKIVILRGSRHGRSICIGHRARRCPIIAVATALRPQRPTVRPSEVPGVAVRLMCRAYGRASSCGHRPLRTMCGRATQTVRWRREEITPVSKPARWRPPAKRACSIFRQRSITTDSPAALAISAARSDRSPKLGPERPDPGMLDDLVGDGR